MCQFPFSWAVNSHFCREDVYSNKGANSHFCGEVLVWGASGHDRLGKYTCYMDSAVVYLCGLHRNMIYKKMKMASDARCKNVPLGDMYDYTLATFATFVRHMLGIHQAHDLAWNWLFIDINDIIPVRAGILWYDCQGLSIEARTLWQKSKNSHFYIFPSPDDTFVTFMRSQWV